MKKRRNLQRLIYGVASVAAIGLSSCGSSTGYNSFDPNCPTDTSYGQNQCPVSITLTPANATIHAFDRVVLQGKVTGFVAQQTVTWRVLGPGLVQGLDCAYTRHSDATFANCPYGYVIYSTTQPPYNAIYYAPAIPGNYQVAMLVYPADGAGVTAFSTITLD
jgi:hypothetical protein